MKRYISIFIITLSIVLSAPVQHTAVGNPVSESTIIKPTSIAPKAPKLAATSEMLVNAKTGDILWRRNSNDKIPMASTTKIITALVALERRNLEETVTVNKDVLGPGKEGGIGLAVNERIRLRELLYALLLPSANDAAVAIADHVAGSVPRFAGMMNRKAAEIGVGQTNFVNPHGLDARMHYSTAADLTSIARYALQNKTFSQIVSTKTWRLSRPGSKQPPVVTNSNTLLSTYSGATGVKTGYTKGAKNCLVSAATRKDVPLISVVLGVDKRPELFKQSAALLDFGFSLYEEKQLITKGITYKTITAKYGQRIDLVAEKSVSASVRASLPMQVNIRYTSEIPLSVKKGTVLGEVAISQNGRVVAVSNLIAKDDCEQLTLIQVGGYYLRQFADIML